MGSRDNNLPKWLERFIKRVIWYVPGRRLRRDTKRGLSIAEETLPILEKQWAVAARLGLSQYLPLYNGMSFVLLLYYDFSLLVLLHATEADSAKQNFYSRQLCSLLYEAMEDMPHVLGKHFRSALKTLPGQAEHTTRLSHYMKVLTTLKNERQALLYEIRNYVAAHRDHDVRKQLEIMRSIDQVQMLVISSQFVEVIGNLANALTKILSEMAQIDVILKSMLNSKR